MTSILGLEEEVTHIAQGQGVTAEKDNLVYRFLGGPHLQGQAENGTTVVTQEGNKWVVAD